jgi:hypothetical protein
MYYWHWNANGEWRMMRAMPMPDAIMPSTKHQAPSGWVACCWDGRPTSHVNNMSAIAINEDLRSTATQSLCPNKQSRAQRGAVKKDKDKGKGTLSPLQVPDA